MDKKVFLYTIATTTLLLHCTSVCADYRQANKPNDLNYSNQSQEYIIHVPAGKKVDAVLSQEINSNTAVVGQTINAILTRDFMHNNNLIASAGSIISGNIVYNRKAGMAGKSAQMQIRFTTIRTPYNNVIPVSALIETKDSTGIIKGEDSTEYSKEHADNNKKTTKIALKSGLGIVKSVSSKGKNIFIPANTNINLIFEQPITLGAI